MVVWKLVRPPLCPVFLASGGSGVSLTTFKGMGRKFSSILCNLSATLSPSHTAWGSGVQTTLSSRAHVSPAHSSKNILRTLLKAHDVLMSRNVHISSVNRSAADDVRSAQQYSYGHQTCISTSGDGVTLKKGSSALVIQQGDREMKIPYVWLRDHCRSEMYYNKTTNQRLGLLDFVGMDLTPVTANLTNDKMGIVITWKDGHTSQYAVSWLEDNYYPGRWVKSRQRLLWDKAILQSEGLPVVSYDEHMTTEAGLRQTLHNLVKYGFSLVKGAPSTLAGTQAVVERVSYVEETLFGGMWMFTSDASRSDTAFTTQYLAAHTDGTYLHRPAGLQVFNCLEHEGSGGETLLVDGFHAVETLRKEDPNAFSILSSVSIPHEYIEAPGTSTPGYHMYTLATVINTHPASGECMHIRFNTYDRAPLNTIPPDSIEAYYEAYNKLNRIIKDESGEFWLRLEPNTVLFIDNWRMLHGRAAFTGKRIMGGCYVPRDEWLSKARRMGVL